MMVAMNPCYSFVRTSLKCRFPFRLRWLTCLVVYFAFSSFVSGRMMDESNMVLNQESKLSHINGSVTMEDDMAISRESLIKADGIKIDYDDIDFKMSGSPFDSSDPKYHMIKEDSQEFDKDWMKHERMLQGNVNVVKCSKSAQNIDDAIKGATELTKVDVCIGRIRMSRGINLSNRNVLLKCTLPTTRCILDGNRTAPIFFGTNTTLTIDGFDLINAYTNDSMGGALSFFGSSDVTIQRSRFIRNRALQGGAIQISNSKLSFDNTGIGQEIVFQSNRGMFGGAIYGINSTIETTTDNGTITFEGNFAIHSGGAMYVIGGEVLLNKTIFKENVAQREGGAGVFIALNVTLNDINASLNVARFNGGAFIFNDSGVTLTNLIAAKNRALASFGAVLFNSSNAFLTNILIGDNNATNTGGVGFANSTATIANGIFESNDSKRRGGATTMVKSLVTLVDVKFFDNTGRGEGRDIFLSDDSMDNFAFCNKTIFCNGKLPPNIFDSGSTLNTNCMLVGIVANCPVSGEPDQKPSTVPSNSPTAVPPSSEHTILPSVVQSFSPTILPKHAASAIPSAVTSTTPSVLPSFVPTLRPTLKPSTVPSNSPTAVPPSSKHTILPSVVRSFSPTILPTHAASAIPSALTSSTPSVLPSFVPTQRPTFKPSYMPSLRKLDLLATCNSNVVCKSGYCVERKCAVCPTIGSAVGCPPNQFCSIWSVRFCVFKRPLSSPCSTNDSCASSYCVNGTCSQPCSTINSQDVCNDSQFCSQSSNQDRLWCTNRQDEGTTCSTNLACKSGFCFENYCRPKLDLFATCNSNVVCKSGYCVDNRCSACPTTGSAIGCPPNQFCTQFLSLTKICVFKRPLSSPCNTNDACTSGYCGNGTCLQPCSTINSQDVCNASQFCTKPSNQDRLLCTNRQDEGTPCSTDLACKSGFCVENYCSKCASNQYYTQPLDQCETKKDIGEACPGDEDPDRDLTCLSGMCVEGFCSECIPESGCADETYSCMRDNGPAFTCVKKRENDDECSSNGICLSELCSENLCTENIENCFDLNICPNNMFCAIVFRRRSRCNRKRAVDRSCNYNQECISGYCGNGTCSQPCSTINSQDVCNASQFCTKPSDQEDRLFCTNRQDEGTLCSTDLACKSGFCVENYCSKCAGDQYYTQPLDQCEIKKEIGEACPGDEDPDKDLACLSGICVDGFCSECIPESGCSDITYSCMRDNGPAFTCVKMRENDVECSSQEICLSQFCSENLCTEVIANCKTDPNICPNNMFCFNGRFGRSWCSRKKALEQSCEKNEECLSGNCNVSDYICNP